MAISKGAQPLLQCFSFGGGGAQLLKIVSIDHEFQKLCSQNSYNIKKTSSVLFVFLFKL